MHLVHQINIDLSPLEHKAFADLKKYAFEPKQLDKVFERVHKDLTYNFTLKLFYDKLKQGGQLTDPEFVYLYDRDTMERSPTNLPRVYLKVHSKELIDLAGRLSPKSVDGLVIRAASIPEASEYIKTVRRHNSLGKLDLQAEVPVCSLEEVETLKKAGFSKVQIPGSFYFQEVKELHTRARTS